MMIVHLFVLVNSYSFTVLIIWITIYISVVFFMILFKKYTEKKNENLQELCKCILKNHVVDCVRILQENPEYINKYTTDGYTPFLIVCASGNSQLLKIMLKKGADVNIKSKNHETAFYLACFYYIKNPHVKDATCIRELYYAGADINEPNDKGLNAIQMAAMFGHNALVKWLLHKNASTNVCPNPLVIAVAQGHQETASVLWKTGSGFAIQEK